MKVYLSCMRFGARNATETAVKVQALHHERDSLFLIDFVQRVQQRQRGDGAKRESSVYFAPRVAGEASIGLLETANELDAFLSIYFV